jgi:RNA polymerase sigma factor (sigma-70 family)
MGAINDYLREQYHMGVQADLDLVPEECDEVIDGEVFEKLIGSLNTTGRKVMRCYYVEGLGQKEIGKQLGVGESRVCQLLKQCRAELHSRWQGQEEQLWELCA